MRKILILVILFLGSCEKEELNPLVSKLRNTPWIVEKAEIIEDGIVTKPCYHIRILRIRK